MGTLVTGSDLPAGPQRSIGRQTLTDSPWFWLLIFANAAVVGVALIGPKYDRREGAVERRFEARRDIAARALGQPVAAPADGGTGQEAGQQEFDSPVASAHIVPLGPLAAALVVLDLAAIVAFTVSRLRLMAAGQKAASSEHP